MAQICIFVNFAKPIIEDQLNKVPLTFSTSFSTFRFAATFEGICVYLCHLNTMADVLFSFSSNVNRKRDIDGE